jgi:Ca2+-binding RTX toxin-like protein
MATIKLLEPTNMRALPSSISGYEVSWDDDEINLLDDAAYVSFSGAFVTPGKQLAVQGTISRVLISDADFGNLDITGLSFDFVGNFYGDIIREGNLDQLVHDLLAGNDKLVGSSGNDTILGFEGNDALFGRGGNDTLFGNDQNDRLTGGTGRDVMTGGNGADVFDFDAVAQTGTTGSTRDRIADFTHLTDDIDLSTIDANGGAAGNTAFSFRATEGAAFSGARGQVRWLQQDLNGTANDKTIIAGDINGDQVADFQIELAGLKTLTSADFFL